VTQPPASNANEAAPLPLAGIRVIDLTRILAGPFCTQLLADLGADVIKIETPDGGDPLREQGVKVDGLSWYFAGFNRNKRSVVLDLRSADGMAHLTDLLRTADVLVENFRPDVLEKMGLSEARLKEINPRLMVCGISGFGRTGPYALRPSFDFIAQAMSGYMSLNGEETGPPLRTALPLSDLIGGLYAALGIVAGLQGRENLGHGQHVGVSLLGGLMSLFAFHSADYMASGASPARTGNDHPIRAPYGLFQAADGPIAVAPSTEVTYQRLMAALGLEHIKADPRFSDNDTRMANRAPLRAAIEAVTRTQTQSYWIEVLNAAGVPCGPVLTVPQALADRQVLHEEMVVDVPHPGRGTVRMSGFPLKFSETPLQMRRPAPELGADTQAVLAEVAARKREGQAE
jgi:CoA:oxalate CoA-transferase